MKRTVFKNVFLRFKCRQIGHININNEDLTIVYSLDCSSKSFFNITNEGCTQFLLPCFGKKNDHDLWKPPQWDRISGKHGFIILVKEDKHWKKNKNSGENFPQNTITHKVVQKCFDIFSRIINIPTQKIKRFPLV